MHAKKKKNEKEEMVITLKYDKRNGGDQQSDTSNLIQ